MDIAKYGHKITYKTAFICYDISEYNIYIEFICTGAEVSSLKLQISNNTGLQKKPCTREQK